MMPSVDGMMPRRHFTHASQTGHAPTGTVLVIIHGIVLLLSELLLMVMIRRHRARGRTVLATAATTRSVRRHRCRTERSVRDGGIGDEMVTMYRPMRNTAKTSLGILGLAASRRQGVAVEASK